MSKRRLVDGDPSASEFVSVRRVRQTRGGRNTTKRVEEPIYSAVERDQVETSIDDTLLESAGMDLDNAHDTGNPVCMEPLVRKPTKVCNAQTFIKTMLIFLSNKGITFTSSSNG